MINLGNSLALRWAMRSGLAVTEQLTVAGANFCLNVAFARWGPTVEYGGFALVQSLFLFSATVYTSVFTEPMMVFVHRHFQSQRQGYYLTVLKAQSWFSIFGFLVFLLAGLLFEMAGFSVVGRALIGFAFAGPSLLVFGLVRRVWYCESRPARSAVAAILYFVLLMATLAVLVRFHALTSISALLATCISAGMATACLFISFGWVPADERPPVRDVARLHWEYARWSAASGLSIWVPGNIGSVLLPIWADLASVGTFRALANFIQPVTQVVTAVGGIAMPALSRQHAMPRFWKYGATLIALLFVFGAVYAGALALGGSDLVQIVYKGRFGDNEPLIAVLALACLPIPVIAAANAILRAKARPDWIFYATVAGAFAAVIVGAVGTMYFGVVGAAMSLFIGYGVNALVALGGSCRFFLNERKAGLSLGIGS